MMLLRTFLKDEAVKDPELNDSSTLQVRNILENILMLTAFSVLVFLFQEAH